MQRHFDTFHLLLRNTCQIFLLLKIKENISLELWLIVFLILHFYCRYDSYCLYDSFRSLNVDNTMEKGILSTLSSYYGVKLDLSQLRVDTVYFHIVILTI